METSKILLQATRKGLCQCGERSGLFNSFEYPSISEFQESSTLTASVSIRLSLTTLW